MSYSLTDLVGLDPGKNIRTKVHRSKVFSKILAYINLKKGASIRIAEAARELQMDSWMVNRNLLTMVSLGLMTRVVQSHQVVYYVPTRNSGRMVLEKYMDDVKQSLGLLR